MEAYEGADWVRISDEVPVDEEQRDRLLEAFQTDYHPGSAGSVSETALEQGDEELDEDEDGQDPGARRTGRGRARSSCVAEGGHGAGLHASRPGRQRGHPQRPARPAGRPLLLPQGRHARAARPRPAGSATTAPTTSGAGARVVGVSPDTVDGDQRKFADKYNLDFTLLAKRRSNRPSVNVAATTAASIGSPSNATRSRSRSATRAPAPPG